MQNLKISNRTKTTKITKKEETKEISKISKSRKSVDKEVLKTSSTTVSTPLSPIYSNIDITIQNNMKQTPLFKLCKILGCLNQSGLGPIISAKAITDHLVNRTAIEFNDDTI